MSATVTYNVTNEIGLDAAIAAADSATAAASYVITLSSDIVLTHSLPVIALAAGASLVIDGTSGPYSLDGGGFGGFVVNAGTVAIDSVTLESFTAGGPGGSGQGGALRVGAGASVALSAVNFAGDSASLGGDIYVASLGALAISGGNVGAGSVGRSGAGSGVFIQGGSTLTLSNRAVVTGVIADSAGTGSGAGAGAVQILGSATLAAPDAYTGGSVIGAAAGTGTLALDAAGAAGSGPISFAAGAGNVLVIGPALDDLPADTIAGFGVGQTIDLLGIGLASGTTLLPGNRLVVQGGSFGAETLALDPGFDYAPTTFLLTADSDGTGTDVSLVQSSFTAASEADLNTALASIDIGGLDTRPGIAYGITFTAGVTLASDLYAINLAAGDRLTINGAGLALDGGHRPGTPGFRGFLVYAGDVTLTDLAIQNADAAGGAGGAGALPGGGGAGLGGGVFVAAGATVALAGVTFSNDGATGGAAGAAGAAGIGGGGGLGGAGGAGAANSPGGGGGVGATASGGSRAGTAAGGGPGIVLGAAGGLPGQGTNAGGIGPSAGGPDGGGGGAGTNFSGGGGRGGGRSSPGIGGSGGVAGGFGGGAGSGSNAGFGGGGAVYGGGANGNPSVSSGDGGWGGGGAGTAPGGFGGGAGDGGAGGGLGAGADVFVEQGGSLTILAGTLGAGTVAGGVGQGAGAAGAAFANGLFIQGSQQVGVAPAAGQTVTVSGTIADESGASGHGGHGGLRLNGAGTLLLSAGNSYSGTTEIDAGTLSLQAPGAAGSGPITFGYAARAALVIGPGDVPTQTIGAFWPGGTIDLQGIGLARSATLAAGDTLDVTGGIIEVRLALDPAQIFTNETFTTADDGHGGTLVEPLTAGGDHPPAILGLPATLSGTDAAALNPLAGVTIADADIGQTETATLTLATPLNGTLTGLGGGTYDSASGVYVVAGDTAAVTAALQGLVFTPTAHEVAPGQTVATQFTLAVSDGTLQAAAGTTLTVTAQNDPPVVEGAGTTLETEWGTPFPALAGVSIVDPDFGASEAVTLTVSPYLSGIGSDSYGSLTGGGLTEIAPGVYTLPAGSPAAVNTLLAGVTFTPIAPATLTEGYTSTSITLDVSDGIAAPVLARVEVDAGLPIITGTRAGQMVVPPATVDPFAGITITDAPQFTSLSVSILVEDPLGTLTDAQGSLSGPPGLTETAAGQYSLPADTAARVTAAVASLVFTPAAVATGQTVETDFFLEVFDGGTTVTRSAGSVLAENPACYLAGTRIATPAGECAVEDLRPGDWVRTLSGRARPVRWIGWRQEACASRRHPELVRPIRIRAGAFGPALPRRDLLLSPDHAVFVDGALIPIARLLNAATIVQEAADRATYLHVELDQHDILLAEGLPAESYLDTGNRASFNDSADAALPRRAVRPCAPTATEAATEALWRRLDRRAAEMGYAAPEESPAADPGLSVWAAGRPLRAVADGAWRHVALPWGGGGGLLRLRSQASAPTRRRPWLADRRRLGVAVRRIVLHGPSGPTEWPVDHPSLQAGWWPVERDGPRLWRWTDGDAALIVPPGTTALRLRLDDAAADPPAAADTGLARGRQKYAASPIRPADQLVAADTSCPSSAAAPDPSSAFPARSRRP